MKQSIITTKNIAKIAAVIVFSAVQFVSCASFKSGVPKEEPSMDTTDSELIQLGQSAYDNNNYKLAEYYYKLLLQRFGSDAGDYVEGRYELAHIAVKRKNYEVAVPMLQEIIEIYESLPSYYLPPSYKKLAEIELEKIPPEVVEAVKYRQEYDEMDDEMY